MSDYPSKTLDTKNAHLVIRGLGGSDSSVCIDVYKHNEKTRISLSEIQCYELIRYLKTILEDNDYVRKGKY